MKRYRFWLLGLVFFWATSLLSAQDLSQHHWKDRLLVIWTVDTLAEPYVRQISLLKEQQSGLDERKLVIYSRWQESYRKGVEVSGWIAARPENLFKPASAAEFEVVLIGLDGSVKLRQQQVLSAEELFARIDAMPMRRQELKK